MNDHPEFEADEDVDPDVLIVEEEERKLPARNGRTARQILEDMRDERE